MAKVDELINSSKEHLSDNENIVAVIMGVYEGTLLGTDIKRKGIFIATENRLVFYAKKMFGFDLESFPYSNISSIEMSKGFTGHSITFFTSGNKVSMKWIDDYNAREKDLAGFFEFIRNNIGQSTNPNSAQQQNENDDIPAQIEKIAELHAQGILTDEEFTSKKQELLARM